MTIKQEKFCDEYILNGGNSAAAARAAGYAAESARVTGSRLINRQDVRQAVNQRLDNLASEKIIAEQELLEFLSSVVRGEVEEEIAVPSGKKVIVKCNCNSRLKACEMLCKIYNMFKRTDDEPKESGAELLTTTLLSIWQKEEKESAQA